MANDSLAGVPENVSVGRVKLEDVSQLTEPFPGGPEGTLGTPADNDACP